MIFKLTILALLSFGSAAFAQSGKSDHSSKKGKTNFPKEVHQTESKQKNKVESNHNSRSDIAYKGSKEKNGNKDSKYLVVSNNQKNTQKGKDKGSLKTNNKNSQGQAQLKGGKGNKGNKPLKFDKPIQIKHPKGGNNNGKQYKGHSGRSEKAYKNKGHYVKTKKVKYNKSHINFGYLYVNTPGFYSKHNYGYYRSQEAKKKHKHYHPVYEYQAVEGFNFIIVRNNFLYTETDNKMRLVRLRLLEKRKVGAISVVEYDNSMNRIIVLEKRRAGLEVNLVL